MKTLSQRMYFTQLEAWIIVSRLEGSQTQVEIAEVSGLAQSVISRTWNRFLETGSTERILGNGRR